VAELFRYRYNKGTMPVLFHANERLLTVTEAAKKLGVTDGWVRKLLRIRKMRGHKVGPKVWLIPESEVEKFREKTSRGTASKGILKS